MFKIFKENMAMVAGQSVGLGIGLLIVGTGIVMLQEHIENKKNNKQEKTEEE